jgi:hypothetical protein
MFKCIDEILTAFDTAEPKGAGAKSSAASDNLFTGKEDCEKVSWDEIVLQFHNCVAKTLHATKQARPDTCAAVLLQQ